MWSTFRAASHVISTYYVRKNSVFYPNYPQSKEVGKCHHVGAIAHDWGFLSFSFSSFFFFQPSACERSFSFSQGSQETKVKQPRTSKYLRCDCKWSPQYPCLDRHNYGCDDGYCWAECREATNACSWCWFIHKSSREWFTCSKHSDCIEGVTGHGKKYECPNSRCLPYYWTSPAVP